MPLPNLGMAFAFTVEPMIDTITFAVEVLVDAVTLAVKPLRQTLFAIRLSSGGSLIQAVVDDVAAAVESAVDLVTYAIKPVIDFPRMRCGCYGADGGQEDNQCYVRSCFHLFLLQHLGFTPATTGEIGFG
ncbi:MAG: hypothetical protein J4A00_02215 [Gammaproteobacteria bacterium]|nr:hypothetical protein [Gammaproteobacteria bacterium]